jgi:hypothetical protein
MLKCPVFRKREGGYSVERGSVTGWTVIASGNSCSTSSPGSRSSSITAWRCAAASLPVEQRRCSSRNVRFEERTANLVLSCGECNLKRGSILGADPESRHRASVKRDCALRRAARFCALKCPVLQKREGAYSVERGSETGSSVIASGNSCSTSSPSSQSSSIAAWCCASASLQVERRATAHRGTCDSKNGRRT